MAATTEPDKMSTDRLSVIEYDLGRILKSSLLNLPPMTTEKLNSILKPLSLEISNVHHYTDIKDELQSFVQSYIHTLPNPLVTSIMELFDKLELPNPVTGKRASRSIVWVVVPFQSTGEDGRNEQREEFIKIMTEVHNYLLEKHGIELRIRFAEQAFTGFERTIGQHPLVEKSMPSVEGVSTPKFNRGALLNAVIDTITYGQLIITHDVDLVPDSPESFDAYVKDIDDSTVLHLAGGWERYNTENRGEFTTYLGGIAGMTPTGWKRVNGYPNDFFGWGGEDDELRRRVINMKMTVDDTYYNPDLFKIRDLENIKTVKDKLAIIGKKDTYNIVKDELNRIHASKGELGNGGLNEVKEITRIISYDIHAEHSWIDFMTIAILPSSYPDLPKSTYSFITSEQASSPTANQSIVSLYQYGLLKDAGYNWNTGESSMEEPDTDYDSIRLPVTIYGPGKLSDPKSISGWRKRLKGLRDDRGNRERIDTDGKSKPLSHYLWMDPTGAFSISYPTTADTMARMIASVAGRNAGIIDMTACIGGNTAYFAYYFPQVTAIEINPYRTEILNHNLRTLLPSYGDELQQISMSDLISLPLSKRPKVSIMDGDSREMLIADLPIHKLVDTDPLGQVLFLDPPWGGPNYLFLPRPLQLEMITRDDGGVSAANFLKPIVERIHMERTLLPKGKGILSGVKYIAMKVPNEYDIEGLRLMLKPFGGTASEPIVIPDETKLNKVNLIMMFL